MTVEEWTRKNPPIQRKPITNYDRFISKTPEELADYLYDHDFCRDPVRSIGNSPCDWDCRKCISEWIKSPVEENPNPVYCVICPSCMSVVKYQKSEVQTDHISCPFCGFSVNVSAIEHARKEELK